MSFFFFDIQKLTYRKEVIDKAEVSMDDKAKMKALLNLHNAVEFISSEESEDNEKGTGGPPPRFIKPLRWEGSKLRNNTAVLDASYEAHKSKRQKRTAAKISERLIKTCQINRYQQTAPHGQDASNSH